MVYPLDSRVMSLAFTYPYVLIRANKHIRVMRNIEKTTAVFIMHPCLA